MGVLLGSGLLGGKRAFDPLSITSIRLWVKADGTLWQDNARTSPVTADAQTVGAWDDLSGQGNHLIQATAANRPTYKTSILNGKPVVRFDATNDRLADTFGAALTQPNTVFLVGKTDSAGTDGRKFFDTPSGGQVAYQENAGAWSMYAGAFINAGVANGNFNYHTIVYNGASSSARVNGVATLSGNAGANSIAGIIMGCDQGFAGFLSGDIAEMLIYNASLSATDRDAVEGYLRTKYGL